MPVPRAVPIVYTDAQNLSVICEVYYIGAKLTVVLVADSARFFKQFGWIARYQFVRLGQRSGQASGPKRTVILGPEVRRKGCPKRTHFGATLGTTLGTSISIAFSIFEEPETGRNAWDNARDRRKLCSERRITTLIWVSQSDTRFTIVTLVAVVVEPSASFLTRVDVAAIFEGSMT